MKHSIEVIPPVEKQIEITLTLSLDELVTIYGALGNASSYSVKESLKECDATQYRMNIKHENPYTVYRSIQDILTEAL